MSEKRGYIQKFILLSVLVISFSFSQKGALTMGFNLFLPRGWELTVGYYFFDNVALQTNIGEFAPQKIEFLAGDSTKSEYHFVGLSLIYKPFHEDISLALGYNNSNWFGGMTYENSVLIIKRYYERFINFTAKYEINLYDNTWKSPVGLGTHIVFRKILKKTEDTNFRDFFNTIRDSLIITIGDSLTMQEFIQNQESFIEEIVKRRRKRIEKKENMSVERPFRFYISSGIIWYSKSANDN